MHPTLPLLRPLLAFLLPLGILGAVALLAPASHARTDAPAPGAPAGGGWVWISNEGSGDLTLVDAARREVVARVPVGKRPRANRYASSGEVRVPNVYASKDCAVWRCRSP